MEQSFNKMMNGYQQEMWKHSKEDTDGGIYTSFKLLLKLLPEIRDQVSDFESSIRDINKGYIGLSEFFLLARSTERATTLSRQ